MDSDRHLAKCNGLEWRVRIEDGDPDKDSSDFQHGWKSRVGEVLPVGLTRDG